MIISNHITLVVILYQYIKDVIYYNNSSNILHIIIYYNIIVVIYYKLCNELENCKFYLIYKSIYKSVKIIFTP